MTTDAHTDVIAAPMGRRRRVRIGDLGLRLVSGVASLLVAVIIVLIAVKLVQGARPAISVFGLGFLTTNVWNAVTNEFGARDLIWGTLVTSVVALVLAVPIAIA